MGCCGAKTIPDENKLGYSNKLVDLSYNPNPSIATCTLYYKNQSPGSDDSPFTDDLFPHNNETLFGKLNGKYTDPNSKRRKLNLDKITFSEDEIEWKRAREIWGEDIDIFQKYILLDDIKLGSLPDAYVIAVLSSMAEFPLLVLQLFKTIELPVEERAIEIGMHIDGIWKIVCVDDYFPVYKESGKPVFSDAPNGAIWGVLLEKAWAKVNGGYANIINGYPKEVFDIFTPFTTIQLNTNNENPNNLWKNIRDADAYNCIMTCSILEGTKGIENVGLIANHTFSLVSAFEGTVEGKVEKLMKLRNPFGEGEWNGDWSDYSPKWTEEAKAAFPMYDGIKRDDGIFWIDFDNYSKYFPITTICVPLKPIISHYFKVPKENATLFNVMKIKVEENGILTFTINKKNPRIHRTIDKEPTENLILVRLDRNRLIYMDSAINEQMSTSVQAGEYICIYHVDYEGINVNPRKYVVTVSGCVSYKIAQCHPDEDLSLLKSILYQNVENIDKYQDRLYNPLVLFTGNHFKNTSIAFVYIKNQTGEDIHFKLKVDLKNIRSIEGNPPSSIFLKNDEKFVFLGMRNDHSQKCECGASGTTTENANKGEVSPSYNQSLVDNYLSDSQYDELNVCFVFNQV